MKVLSAEPKKCTGCKICEQWCTISHYNVMNPKKSRISVTRSHDDLMNYPVACHQCVDAPCIAACPTKISALSRDENTGAIIVDENKCILCKACIRACPYDAMKAFPAAKHVFTCDLCGGDPQCVKHCPQGVLSYEEMAKEVI